MKSEASNIFMNFLGAVKAVNYYPIRHPSRIQPATRAHQLLKPLLAKRGTVSLAIVEDVLVFEGEPFFGDDGVEAELKEILDERRIKEIRFSKGISDAEILVLVEVLSAGPELLASWDSIHDYLRNQSVRHIEVEEEEPSIRDKAKKVYGEAKDFILDIMQQERAGALPRGEKAIEVVSNLQEVILEDKDAIMGLTLLSDYDNYTFNHSVNVGVFSLALAHELGMSQDEITLSGLSGMLHDVGKTNIPLSIINKPGKLTDEEWRIMQTHPVESAKLCKEMGSALREEVITSVLTHHVRHDHAGYPAWEKPLLFSSEITSVGDCYDSMTTLRPYQKRFEPRDAIMVMQRIRGKALNPEYVDRFIKMLGVYPVGSVVRLNTNEIAIVFANTAAGDEFPTVKLIIDKHGNTLTEPEILDLSSNASKVLGITRRLVATVDPTIRNIDVAKFL